MVKALKESRQFNISVEGINCERLYFNHLSGLINASGKNKYNASIYCRKASPTSFAKRNAYKQRCNLKVPYVHIQDVEDFNDKTEEKRFYALLDELANVETDFGISYNLGYTNYTFELWILLHVADMKSPVVDKSSYLKYINHYFHKSYTSLNQFKTESEFQGILDKYITFDSVCMAVKRADAIVRQNEISGNKCEYYGKFRFFKDNPDLTVHEIIKIIFNQCQVKI